MINEILQSPKNKTFCKFLYEPKSLHQPLSYEATNMDMLCVSTCDTSQTESWHGPVHLESVFSIGEPGRRLVGFHLTGCGTLQDNRKTKWVLRLLIRALLKDTSRPRHLTHVSAWEILCLYAHAIRLLIRHPRTWRIRAI